jgi:hypothetical protein
MTLMALSRRQGQIPAFFWLTKQNVIILFKHGPIAFWRSLGFLLILESLCLLLERFVNF